MKKRVCLAIETTATYLGLALHDMNAPAAPALGHFSQAMPGEQAEQLFPTLDRLMTSARVKRADLALVAVDHGPGSFTGVRVGVASARAVAQSLALPLVGIGSLEAIAAGAALSAPAGALTVAARIPALPGDSYFALYRRTAGGRWSTLSKPVWTTDAKVDAALRKVRGPLALGLVPRAKDDGLAVPSNASVQRVFAPDPSVIARLAMVRGGKSPSAARFPLEKVVPIYLQPSWAERLKPKGAKRPA